MEIVNESAFNVNATQMFDTSCKCHLLVVAKATYDFPSQDFEQASLSNEQYPIFDTDIFEGEPGLSAPYFESDWAFRKRLCDIILKATAYAPDNTPRTSIPVKFKLAACEKKLRVIGPRNWEPAALGGITTTAPKAVASMPITYSRSYGGSWFDDEEAPVAFMDNPVGCGFGKRRHHAQMLGTTAPCIGPFDEDFSLHTKPFAPCSFGPLGRNWTARSQYAGTYDENWKANVFPLLPQDFDERFYQCAPQDQQIPYPKGGEVVSLWNLHPKRKQLHFTLPSDLHLPMVAIMRKGDQLPIESVVDTITIDADSEKISLVWRAQLPINRSIREIATLAVGEIYEELWNTLIYGEDLACGDCGLAI